MIVYGVMFAVVGPVLYQGYKDHMGVEDLEKVEVTKKTREQAASRVTPSSDELTRMA